MKKKKEEIDNPIVDTSYYQKGGKKTSKQTKQKKLSKREQEELEEERRQRREELKRQKEENQKAKRRHLKALFVFLIIIILFAIGAFIYTNLTDEARVVRKYFDLLKEKQYEEMYDLVITDLNKEEFVARIKNIYEGVEAKDISCVITANTKAEGDTQDTSKIATNVSYRFDMQTIAGSMTFNNTAKK